MFVFHEEKQRDVLRGPERAERRAKLTNETNHIRRSVYVSS